MKNLIQETLFIYFVSVWGAQNPKKKKYWWGNKNLWKIKYETGKMKNKGKAALNSI